tara:strand:- start:114 stop:1028 length:915 start_codon:yes stop_codon:yes gene_type:complete
MKIYINSPKESWVVDRFVKEWKENNKNISTNLLSKADLIWIISPWTWKKLSKKHLSSKKVICTIHHIDDKKFNIEEFSELDKLVDRYHIISKKTENTLKQLTKKDIFYSPFWIDSKKFFNIKDNQSLRKKFNIKDNDFAIGSFQRDTEGSDNKSPKLEKGPDNFIEIIKNLDYENKNLKVVLTGKRRNYIINKLNELKISFEYFQMVDNKRLNELYNSLDLYIVASRVEGGPQSILECALSKTPIISTDVGVANQILSDKSIFTMKEYRNAKPNVEHAYREVQKYIIPEGFESFINFFEDVYES